MDGEDGSAELVDTDTDGGGNNTAMDESTEITDTNTEEVVKKRKARLEEALDVSALNIKFYSTQKREINSLVPRSIPTYLCATLNIWEEGLGTRLRDQSQRLRILLLE